MLKPSKTAKHRQRHPGDWKALRKRGMSPKKVLERNPIINKRSTVIHCRLLYSFHLLQMATETIPVLIIFSAKLTNLGFLIYSAWTSKKCQYIVIKRF